MLLNATLSCWMVHSCLIETPSFCIIVILIASRKLLHPKQLQALGLSKLSCIAKHSRETFDWTISNWMQVNISWHELTCDVDADKPNNFIFLGALCVKCNVFRTDGLDLVPDYFWSFLQQKKCKFFFEADDIALI